EGQVQEARVLDRRVDVARGGRREGRQRAVAGRQGRGRVAVPQQEEEVEEARRRPQAREQGLHLQGQVEVQGQVARADRLPGPGALEEDDLEVPDLHGQVGVPIASRPWLLLPWSWAPGCSARRSPTASRGPAGA